MDLLVKIKQIADHFLVDVLDPRMILTLMRLASILFDSACVLQIGLVIRKPATPIIQAVMFGIGIMIAMTTPMEGVLRVRREMLFWVVVGCVMALAFGPVVISRSLSPYPQTQARIRRTVWLGSVAVLMAQAIAVTVKR